MLTKQVPLPPHYLFCLFNMPGRLVRLMEGSVLGKCRQSHWSSVYRVALSHHSHTAWGNSSFQNSTTPVLLPCTPLPPASSRLIFLLSEISSCPGGRAVIASTVQVCPTTGWSSCLPCGLLETPGAMLWVGEMGATSGIFFLDVFKHVTIRSGLIFSYA